MSTKMSKNSSLLFYFLVYLFAFAIGFLFANSLSSSTTPLWLTSLIFDVISTVLVWTVGLIIKNPSIYDPYWSVLPPVMLIYWFILGNVSITFLNGLILFSVLFWSIRLTYNFIINFDGFEYQDWRYKMLKAKNPRLWFITNFFGINLMPTLIVFIQLLTTLHIIDYSGKINLVFFLGFLICVGAAILQYFADKQMRNFRLLHSEQKACMRDGIWSYSRHPNYFGEVAFWWGLWVMYIGLTGTFDFYIISPFLMTLLFLFISIPMMEKKILSTRPEYKEIQESISIFVPFFPKKQKDRK